MPGPGPGASPAFLNTKIQIENSHIEGSYLIRKDTISTSPYPIDCLTFERCLIDLAPSIDHIDLTDIEARLHFENCLIEYADNFDFNSVRGIRVKFHSSDYSIIRVKDCIDEWITIDLPYPKARIYPVANNGQGIIIYDNKFAIAEIDYTTGTKDICRIMQRAKIKRVVTLCIESFDGTTTVDIGISSDTDGFLPNSSISKTTYNLSGIEDDELGALLWDSTNGHKREYYNEGEYVIQATVNNTDSTQGELLVFVEFDRLYN